MQDTREKTQNSTNLKTIILSALMAAIVYAGTSIIKIPTPTQGYIHPGDGFVLLSTLLLGPLWGSLTAGIGSGLSDLLGGYLIYAPATFIIKALTALVGYLVFAGLSKIIKTKTAIPQLIVSGIAGELIMISGYFIFEIFMLSVVNHSSLVAGVIAAAAGIVPNLIQAAFGVAISTALYPLLSNLLKSQTKD